jgi:hypothetical protein
MPPFPFDAEGFGRVISPENIVYFPSTKSGPECRSFAYYKLIE